MARRLSSQHLEKYLEGGMYHEFLQYVKADRELAFEIRVKDEVMIYCQKNLILTISHRKNNSDKITMLDSHYYTKRKDGLKLTMRLEDSSDLNDMQKVRQYFEDAKALCKSYKSNDEFIVQQQYKTEHNSFVGEYIAIDMEWGPDQAKIPVEYRLAKTKIDLLVVSNKPNEEGKHDIYLAEVKCGLGAVGGKSGIDDHVRKSQAIINNVYVRQNLLQDVMSLIRQKAQLGLFEGSPIRYNFTDRPKMMFILANSSEYDKLTFDRIINNLGEVERSIKVEYIASTKGAQPAKAHYGGDSEYRRACRQHQAWFRENVLKLAMGRNRSTHQGVNETAEEFEHRRRTETDTAVLTNSDAARLMNFIPEYHEEIRKALIERRGRIPINDFGLMNNMLRSEHVPWNIFVPLMTDLTAAANCFAEIFPHRDIKTIRKWKIEYAPNTINDRSAFDAYIVYETSTMKTGAIGIEVKYTEEGYPVGNKEFEMMQNPSSAYSVTTRNSECFIKNDPLQFNNPDFIQLWRNHILGLAMLQQGRADYFDSLTLYPKGNVHFHSSDTHIGVIEAYEDLLTEKGNETFHAITYEDFFNILKKNYTSDRNKSWMEYLETRYINKSH